MTRYVTKSLAEGSGGNTELTKTTLRDQATVTFIQLAVKKMALRNVRQVGSSHPVRALQRELKVSLAEEFDNQRFRKHTESNFLETGTLCPEQRREPAEFCRTASPAHLLSEVCLQHQRHATQESHGGSVDPSLNSGSLESAVRPLLCHR